VIPAPLVSAVALLATGLFAVADWIAVGRENRRLEYVAKPATLVALAAWAATGGHPSPWLLAALVLSLAGDVLLMLPTDRFVAGLGAFLAAHVAYVLRFEAPLGERLPWLGVPLVLALPVAGRILRAAGSARRRVVLAAYGVTIAAMVASALASGDGRAMAGALLFLASDGLIAWTRFVGPVPGAAVGIIVTYHVGQLGLVAALR